MESSSDSGDDVEKKLKLQLLSEDSSNCVCSKAWEKSLFLGWRPSEVKKAHKKRCETSRAGNQGLLRRERTVLAATGDFLFRHYESIDRYMVQYRENHSTSCMEREMNLMPVLGVDVPDPYLPKITSSSVLMERIKIIEALSEFYKFPTKDTSDVRNICLTGKKAEPGDRFLPPTPRKSSDSTLPALIINSAGNVNDSQCLQLPTVREGEDEECSAQPEQKRAIEENCSERTKNDSFNCVRFEKIKKDIRKTHGEMDNKSKKESFVLPAAKLVCNEAQRDLESQYYRTALPRIPLWTEYEPNKERQRKEKVLETLRIGKKCKPSKNSGSGSESRGESLNLRSNLNTREEIPPPSRGNLRLGTTVRPATNHKDVKRKSRNPQPQQNRYDLNNNAYLSGSSHSLKIPKLPVETTFIKILGNQTNLPVPSKPSNAKTEKKRNTPRAKIRQASDRDYQGIPLRYLRKFGRHSFNHVLEARSYKPETRKLGSTIIPN